MLSERIEYFMNNDSYAMSNAHFMFQCISIICKSLSNTKNAIIKTDNANFFLNNLKVKAMYSMYSILTWKDIYKVRGKS